MCIDSVAYLLSSGNRSLAALSILILFFVIAVVAAVIIHAKKRHSK